MDAGVVDDDLDRARRQQALAGGLRRGAIGDVEGDRLGAAALGDDSPGDRLGGLEPGVGMDDDVRAVARQPLGDRLADAAAGAGDQGAPSEGGLGRALMAGRHVEDDGEAPGSDLAAPRARCERRRAAGRRRPPGARRRCAARRSPAGGQVVEPPGAEPHLARARQVAGRRARARRLGQQAAVQGRGLRGVLDRRAGHQAAAAAQADAPGRGGRRRRHSIRPSSHATMRSSRHIVPRCGTSASMPAWSSSAGLQDSLRGGPRVATSSTFANGVPWDIGRSDDLRSRGRRAARSIRRRPGRSAAAPGSRAAGRPGGRPTG